MDLRVFHRYRLAMPALQAEESLRLITATSYPDLAKKTDKTNILRSLQRVIDRTIDKTSGKLATFGDVVSAARRIGG